MDDPAGGGADRARAGAAGQAGEVESRPVQLHAQQILDTFGRARPVTITNAMRIPGSTVRVAGRAVPGPGGPLRAPISGVECVWYRSVVARHLRPTQAYPSPPLKPLHPLAHSDTPNHAGPRTRGFSGPRLADDHSSSATFGLDDGTGVLVVDPATTDVDSNVFARNAVVEVDDPARDTNALGFGGGPFDHQELHTEWVIPIGAPLLAVGVVGTVDGRPGLVVSAQEVVLVSTKPEQQILSRNRAAVDPAAAHLPFRSPRSIYLFLGAVLTVALAVVITLVVLFVIPH